LLTGQPGRRDPASHRQIRYPPRSRSVRRRPRLLRLFRPCLRGAAADSAVWACADGGKRRCPMPGRPSCRALIREAPRRPGGCRRRAGDDLRVQPVLLVFSRAGGRSAATRSIGMKGRSACCTGAASAGQTRSRRGTGRWPGHAGESLARQRSAARWNSAGSPRCPMREIAVIASSTRASGVPSD